MEELSKKEKRELRRTEWEEKAHKQEQQAKLKKLAIWAGVAIISALFVFGLIKLASTSGEPALTDEPLKTPVSASDVSVGSETAKATLVEYADFQCPSCKLYHPTIKQILAEYGDSVRYVYRFMPLVNIHKNAQISAQAGYGAHLQGKFMEMNDLLFQNQDSWAEEENPKATFESYAEQIGLDVDKFKADIESDETKGFVQEQTAQGINDGIRSTPTFFFNGKFIKNPSGFDGFKVLIDEALSK